jgi:hypothetical protein
MIQTRGGLQGECIERFVGPLQQVMVNEEVPAQRNIFQDRCVLA